MMRRSRLGPETATARHGPFGYACWALNYTTGKQGYDRLQEGGWTGEGIGFYSDDAKTVAVWRLFNPYVEVGTHHYTTGLDEYEGLPAFGWIQEGVGWYALR